MGCKCKNCIVVDLERNPEGRYGNVDECENCDWIEECKENEEDCESCVHNN